MQREPRGFVYTLEPLHTKCDWDLQQLRADLAQLGDRFESQGNEVRRQEALFAAATAEFTARRGETKVIFADQQQLEHAYLSRLTERLQQARKVLIDLEAERDAAIAKLHQLQKYADELEENRVEEIKNHGKVVAKAEIAEADDAWLRGMTWRATQ